MFCSDHARLRRRLDLLAAFCMLWWGVSARPAWAQGAVIDIGSAAGLPGQAVDVTVSLAVTGGAMAAATLNDIAFGKQALRLDPADCRVSAADKTLTVRIVRDSRTLRMLRVVVQSIYDGPVIPDGPLYTCTFHISPGASPGNHAVTILHSLAFAPTGAPILGVTGMDGAVMVTTVPVPSATPTQSPTPTPTPTSTPTPTAPPSATLTPDLCPSDLMLAPAAGAPGTQVMFSGRCYFIHSGRRAAVYFDDIQVANVIGDTIGNYSGVMNVPTGAALGTHRVRVVMPREIAAASFEVVPSTSCAGDCNGDGVVTIDEVLQIAAVILGQAPPDSCPFLEDDGNGGVAIDALVSAVQQALGGCHPPS